jgi:hypothetical protein
MRTHFFFFFFCFFLFFSFFSCLSVCVSFCSFWPHVSLGPRPKEKKEPKKKDEPKKIGVATLGGVIGKDANRAYQATTALKDLAKGQKGLSVPQKALAAAAFSTGNADVGSAAFAISGAQSALKHSSKVHMAAGILGAARHGSTLAGADVEKLNDLTAGYGAANGATELQKT